MDTALHFVIFCFAYTLITVHTVPPEACFANFRWDDCGKPPVPVMYYWKPGSRCEVGMWRGCLPNINMFQDEYECVSTCIFTVRAQPENYHQNLAGIEYEVDGVPVPTVTDATTVNLIDGTVSEGTQDSNTQEGDNATTSQPDAGDNNGVTGGETPPVLTTNASGATDAVDNDITTAKES